MPLLSGGKTHFEEFADSIGAMLEFDETGGDLAEGWFYKPLPNNTETRAAFREMYYGGLSADKIISRLCSLGYFRKGPREVHIARLRAIQEKLQAAP